MHQQATRDRGSGTCSALTRRAADAAFSCGSTSVATGVSIAKPSSRSCGSCLRTRRIACHNASVTVAAGAGRAGLTLCACLLKGSPRRPSRPG
jgi:hypothetical protein